MSNLLKVLCKKCNGTKIMKTIGFMTKACDCTFEVEKQLVEEITKAVTSDLKNLEDNQQKEGKKRGRPAKSVK